MNKLSSLIEIVKASNHVPVVLSLFLGLCFVEKESYLFREAEDTCPGDNIPAAFLDRYNY